LEKLQEDGIFYRVARQALIRVGIRIRIRVKIIVGTKARLKKK